MQPLPRDTAIRASPATASPPAPRPRAPPPCKGQTPAAARCPAAPFAPPPAAQRKGPPTALCRPSAPLVPLKNTALDSPLTGGTRTHLPHCTTVDHHPPPCCQASAMQKFNELEDEIAAMKQQLQVGAACVCVWGGGRGRGGRPQLLAGCPPPTNTIPPTHHHPRVRPHPARARRTEPSSPRGKSPLQRRAAGACSSSSCTSRPRTAPARAAPTAAGRAAAAAAAARRRAGCARRWTRRQRRWRRPWGRACARRRSARWAARCACGCLPTWHLCWRWSSRRVRAARRRAARGGTARACALAPLRQAGMRRGSVVSHPPKPASVVARRNGVHVLTTCAPACTLTAVPLLHTTSPHPPRPQTSQQARQLSALTRCTACLRLSWASTPGTSARCSPPGSGRAATTAAAAAAGKGEKGASLGEVPPTRAPSPPWPRRAAQALAAGKGCVGRARRGHALPGRAQAMVRPGCHPAAPPVLHPSLSAHAGGASRRPSRPRCKARGAAAVRPRLAAAVGCHATPVDTRQSTRTRPGSRSSDKAPFM